MACLVSSGLFGNCEMAWCEGRGMEVAACIAVMKNMQHQLSSLNGGQLMVSSFIGAGACEDSVAAGDVAASLLDRCDGG